MCFVDTRGTVKGLEDFGLTLTFGGLTGTRPEPTSTAASSSSTLASSASGLPSQASGSPTATSQPASSPSSSSGGHSNNGAYAAAGAVGVIALFALLLGTAFSYRMMKRRRLASRQLQLASPNPYDPRITPIDKPRPAFSQPATLTSATAYTAPSSTAPSSTAYASHPSSSGYTERKVETSTVVGSWQWPAAMPHTPMTPTSPMSFDMIERGMSRATIRMSAATASTDWVHLDLRLSSPTPSMLRAYPGRIGSPSPSPEPPSPQPISGIPIGVHDTYEEDFVRPSFDSLGFAMPPPTYRSPSRQTDFLVPVSAAGPQEGNAYGGLHIEIPQPVRARPGVGPPF
ncbi:unnamed protein product [Peniophora sp. CBMAI 1063]|nr:unnamed protein product [Peniophora sp. CBMAI 1063]